MLSELYIRNFAIIDELRMRFRSGFNVLTGETGTGKSIILDAVSLVLGERADTTVVRAGCENAYVEATFALNAEMRAQIGPVLANEGLDEGENDYLLLARELRLNGRNICRINGRAVTLSLLRQVAEPLIDIHGQGEHLSLLKPRSHLGLLDSYAALAPERKALAEEVRRLQKVQRDLKALRQSERNIEQRTEFLQYQIAEIDAAKLEEGEEAELRAERTRLANAENLMLAASTAVALLAGLDDDAASAVDLLGQVERSLNQLIRYDETRAPLLERLQGLTFQINELAAELQDYLDELEFNPTRLDFVEERLELINRLKRKYDQEDIAALLALREVATAELEQITHSEERMAELAVEEKRYLRRIGTMAQELSQKRKTASQELSRAVETQLADLQLGGADFSVDFVYEPAAEGVYVGEERLAFDHTGIDRVEFLISTNPGEPLKPLAKVASGGETARLMLALKTALAQVDATPTLIFDEIDQGIGGRVGAIVGRKLWGLTAMAQHQVIVVTHLPQLAGYGDLHFNVRKHITSGRTTTTVMDLDPSGRVDELAAMLGTQSDHARGGAQAILQEADETKRSMVAEQ